MRVMDGPRASFVLTGNGPPIDIWANKTFEEIQERYMGHGHVYNQAHIGCSTAVLTNLEPDLFSEFGSFLDSSVVVSKCQIIIDICHKKIIQVLIVVMQDNCAYISTCARSLHMNYVQILLIINSERNPHGLL